RRLRGALDEFYRARFEPSPDAFVLSEKLDPDNFRKREWRRIWQRAAIGRRALKDLRDTFASQLLTCGVSLGYVSKQLGHARVGVTEKHYAKWIETEDEGYREPMRLQEGEVPADLLSRLPQQEYSPVSGSKSPELSPELRKGTSGKSELPIVTK
ncbi:MAG: hypothetical protein V3T14_04860, partial [Myxococcota bacterium]